MAMRSDDDPLDDLSSLIGAIYDCALAPERWSDTLAAIADRLRCTQAALSLQALPSGRVLLNVATGIPQPWVERVRDYGADIVALWGGADAIAAAPLEEPVLLTEMNPEVGAGTSRNRYYREVRRPQRLLDTMTLGLARDTTSLATVSFVRHEADGAFADEERALARRLAPHLRRAVTISRLLDARTVAAANFEAALAAIETPVLLADAGLTLLHANPAGQALLDRGIPLRLRAGVLQSPLAEVMRALADAACRIGEKSSWDDERLAIAAPGIDAPHALHLLPLHRPPLRHIATAAALAIFVASPPSSVAGAGALLAPLYRLTAAEADVLDRIARGDAVSRIAADLRVKVSTVRTHLVHLYAKLGVSRQTDLVRFAAALTRRG